MMRYLHACLFLAAATLCLMIEGNAWSQFDDLRRNRTAQTIPSQTVGFPSPQRRSIVVEPQQTEAQKKLSVRISKLNSAQTDGEKEKAKAQIEAVLTQIFEEDMETREKEIAKVEARVKNLRAQFDKRDAAKEEIIKLRLQVIINQSEGLGFLGQPNGGWPVPTTTYGDSHQNYRYQAPPTAWPRDTIGPASTEVLSAPRALAPTNEASDPLDGFDPGPSNYSQPTPQPSLLEPRR